MRWNDHWHNGVGPGFFIFGALMMALFWGGVAWVVVTLVRRSGPQHPTPPLSHALGSSAPEQILHERFARGEIDSEEYQHRLSTLRSATTPPPGA